MRHLNAEALNQILRSDFIEQYEYNKRFEDAAQDLSITVNTSGSTRSPKPLILYYGRVAQMDITTCFLP